MLRQQEKSVNEVEFKKEPSNNSRARGALYLEKEYQQQNSKIKKDTACRMLLAGMRHKAKMA